VGAQGYVAERSSSSTSPSGGGVVAAFCGLEKRVRSCTCCTNDEEEIVALQKPLAIDLAPHNPRASQVDPNPVPSRASDSNAIVSQESDPNSISLPLHISWWDKSRLTVISPLAQLFSPLSLFSTS
jgi:hypothetical protein